LLAASQHSHLPAGNGSLDALVGVVRPRDILADALASRPLDVQRYVRAAPVLPDNTDALDALAALRAAEMPLLLVHDEYGHFEGLITPADLLQVIAGAFHSDRDDEPGMVAREDGSWLLAGWLPAEDIVEALGVSLPAQRSYHTVAGLVLSAFGRLPAIGEAEDIHGWRFEVLDLDGRRIDKVLASPLLIPAVAARRPGQGP
jgi:putative hemolysin